MNPDPRAVPPGLTLIATPLGHARDITLRALDCLAGADVLAAEDTRSLRRLMDIHGIALDGRPCLSYHEHNGAQMRPKLMAYLSEGRRVVYASEAGTPLISDPGFDLVQAAVTAGHQVTTAPGPSAAIAALTLAGLPTDRFLFLGFLPNARAARRRALAEVAPIGATLVLYESPKRLAACLADAADVLGAERNAAVCRELTKKFEELRRGPLGTLAGDYADAAVKGEIVVVIGRGHSENVKEADVETALRDALRSMSVRDAADTVAAMFKLARRPIYQQAMRLKAEEGDR